MAQRKRWHYIKFWTVCSVKRDAHKSENEIFSCLFAHCLTTAYHPICNLHYTKLCRNWTAAKAYTYFLVFLFSHDVQTWELKLTRSTRPIDAKLWKKLCLWIMFLISKYFITKHFHIKYPRYFRFYIWYFSYFEYDRY